MTTIDYEQFEKDWKKRHKASLPRRVSVSSASAIFWILFWVIVAIGAAIFSAVHTIPSAEMTLDKDIPQRQYFAITAFVIVEFVIFGSAAKRHEITWLRWLLLCSLLVGLIGNVSSSFNAVYANEGNILNYIAGILLSIIAPVTALAAGEVLHIQIRDLNQRQKLADEEFQRQWKDVDSKINAAFTKQEKAQIEAVNLVNLRKFTDVSRPSPKMKKAIDWLNEHPEHIETESRVLAEMIGVSHTLANGARKAVLASQNGHSGDE